MAVTNYYSVGGEILGEETGGVRRDYLTDALGSVTGTVTSAGAIENTYRYKPYGAQLSKTGSGTDPAFTWVGKWGYRQTAKTFSDVYIRARSFSRALGIFISWDPAFFNMGDMFNSSFLYSYNNPIIVIDSSGLHPMFRDLLCKTGGVNHERAPRECELPFPRKTKHIINGNINQCMDNFCSHVEGKKGNYVNSIKRCANKAGIDYSRLIAWCKLDPNKAYPIVCRAGESDGWRPMTCRFAKPKKVAQFPRQCAYTKRLINRIGGLPIEVNFPISILCNTGIHGYRDQCGNDKENTEGLTQQEKDLVHDCDNIKRILLHEIGHIGYPKSDDGGGYENIIHVKINDWAKCVLDSGGGC